MTESACPACRAELRVPAAAAGKAARCPRCRAVHPVPAPDPGFEVVEGDEHTTDRTDPRLRRRSAADPRQDAVHFVLSKAERARGFVRPVRPSYRHDRCGGVTTMSRPLAESAARDPGLYASGFCYACGGYFPVGGFVWVEADGTVTGDRCGS